MLSLPGLIKDYLSSGKIIHFNSNLFLELVLKLLPPLKDQYKP